METDTLKVLIIDDNADNLTALRAVIRNLLPGCPVLTAPDGACGIETARAADPDVILLDLAMQGLDSFTVCCQLKADEHLRSIPVVFLIAADTGRETRVRALEAGGDGFLTKPADELQLVATIRAMAKIRAANRVQRLERDQLVAMAAERTRKIELSRRATLNLLEDLRAEIEVRKQTETELRRAADALRAKEDRQREFVALLSELINESRFFSGDLDQNLRRIIVQSAEVMKTERTGVWLYSRDLSQLRCHDLYERASGGYSEGEVLNCAEFPEYLASHQLGKVIVATDVRADPRTLQIPAAYYEAHGIRALLDAPIWIHGRLAALLSFEHTGEVRTWLAEEEQLAQTLATFISSCLEAAERERTEIMLRTALRERETLLKEVHHRVKNNLQVIDSLMGLQARQDRAPGVAEAFRAMQNRVRSMALLHEALYHSDDLAQIDLKRYVERMCRHLAQSFGADGTRIRLEARVGGVKLPLDRAVPCGLLINELVTNVLKHAFPGGRPGRATVALESDGDRTLVLTVADDGVGLRDAPDAGREKSLGLELVRRLTSQLEGTLDIDRTPPGTAFRIAFPMQ